LRIAGGAPIVAAGLILSCAALAESLPKTATPLSKDAVTRIYSDRTAIWKDADAYFAPDHTEKGVLGKPKATSVFMGTWTVSGNEICVYNFHKNSPATFRDCYKYWQDGKRVVTLWSIHSDGSPVDENNGYYVGEVDKLKPGDLVSDKYAAAGGW